jgi:hypothetical protein
VDAARRVTARRLPSRSAATLAVAVAAAFAAALALAGPSVRPAAALSLLAVPDTRTIVHDHTTTVPAPGVLQNDVTVLGSVAILNSQPAHGSSCCRRTAPTRTTRTRLHRHRRVQVPRLRRAPLDEHDDRHDHGHEQGSGRGERSLVGERGRLERITARAS